MRTKILLMTAALAAAGTIATNAQVFSVNAVGYVNKTIPAKGYAMISNPLVGQTNTLNALFSGQVPDGLQIFTWNTTKKSFDFHSYIDGVGFDPDGDTFTLVPGQGAFAKNPTATDVKVTFVGEVKQGTPIDTPLVPGLQIVSSQVPQAGTLEQLGFGQSAETATSGPVDGDKVFKWNSAGNKYDFDSYIGGAGWDTGLQFDVGDAFFLSRTKAGTWSRNFTVNTQ